MAGAWQRPDTALIATGLLGGSFNPAHGGHRMTSLMAMEALCLDALWWLVSPGNPLKPKAGMAPLPARLASAQKMTRGTRICATAIERELGTRYTIDTLRLLVRRYPKRRFIWLMGADNMVQFHRWKDWRKIAQLMPIAVIARPGYDGGARAAVAMGWLRAHVRPPSHKNEWMSLNHPAVMFLRFPPDSRSATQLRLADPAWHEKISTRGLRDPVTHHFVSEELS